DGRASLWHDQGQDGSNPLPDEDAAPGCLGDGAARAGLQSHPCHEHHGHSATHGRDEGIVKPKKCSHTTIGQDPDASTLPVKRFYTTKTRLRHWSAPQAIYAELTPPPSSVLD